MTSINKQSLAKQETPRMGDNLDIKQLQTDTIQKSELFEYPRRSVASKSRGSSVEVRSKSRETSLERAEA
jgi:hypothetical protein